MSFQDTFNERVMPAANRAFGITARLYRGGLRSNDFTALWENVTYDVADEQGFITQFSSRDFSFDLGIIVISGETIKPRPGDQIEMTEVGVLKRFEILPLGKAPAVDDLEGGYRQRAHTKQLVYEQ
jgi:hypothetical protein